MDAADGRRFPGAKVGKGHERDGEACIPAAANEAERGERGGRPAAYLVGHLPGDQYFQHDERGRHQTSSLGDKVLVPDGGVVVHRDVADERVAGHHRPASRKHKTIVSPRRALVVSGLVIGAPLGMHHVGVLDRRATCSPHAEPRRLHSAGCCGSA